MLKPDMAESISLNRKHAVIVRLGEKKILRGVLERVHALKGALQLSVQSKAKDRKRARESEVSQHGKGKKSKR